MISLLKDSPRSRVFIGERGAVHKLFRGPRASERFETEVRVLQFLGQQHCDFVPRLLSFARDRCEIVTTHSGSRIEYIDSQRVNSLFQELESYGVRHDDPDPRNITYRPSDGRFCIIDFEFATILEPALCY